MSKEGNFYFMLLIAGTKFLFHRMAAMLSKFRIDFSDVIVITDITKKSSESTRNYFDGLIKNFVKNEDGQSKLGISNVIL